jgi:dipeptidyl aminopeptidase/acylaminoacyl peptidase
MYFGYDYWEKAIDMNSLWVGRAPQTFVSSITTPTLILHGTEDQYTDISNSREMYRALKELGRTVEFVTYPRAGHGLRTEPNQYINSLERTVDWFVRFLKQPGPRR